MRAIEATDGSAYQIRVAFTDTMARASYEANYGHIRSGHRGF